MKRSPIRAAVLLVFSLLPSLASGGVEGTHHDMRHMTGDNEKSLCAYCHVPHNAKSDKGMFAREGTNASLLGRVGAFCYSCHDGTVTPNAIIEPPNGKIGLPALTESHGYNTAAIAAKTGHVETISNIKQSGLVSINPATGEPNDDFDCMSCHDVHNATYPPFLNAPIDVLCQKCHSGSNFMGKGRWTKVENTGGDNGAHPIDMAVSSSGLDKQRNLSEETSFHTPDPIFRKPLLNFEQIKDVNKHWTMGGHLFGAKDEVSCSTCHSAHMPAERLLVAAGEPEREKTLCAGCHGDGHNPSNPGATAGYHPVFEESEPPYVHDHSSHPSLVDLPKQGYIELFVDLPKEYPIESDGTLTCRSCHSPHNGLAGTKGLKAGTGNWLAKSICNDCHHMGSEVPRVDMHHPISASDYTKLGFPQLTSWAWGPGLPGDLTDGLQCVDCHIDWAISAHNW